MTSRMWCLDEFRYDDQIQADEVSVFFPGDDESDVVPRDEAITRAHALGANLVAMWPASSDATPTCLVAKVTEPLRWETVPDAGDDEVDERLWFEACCGGRDFLRDGYGHTFRGRMTAYCPEKDVHYNVSLSEMGAMSDESRYFILGFLSGNEPDPPYGTEGEIADRDLQAWRSAVVRFRRTGSWYGRWGTCEVCGCVLLPDSHDQRCAEHVVSDGT